MEVVLEDSCDDSEEECPYECFYGGSSQYDLFYDAEAQRALLVTRWYEELDDEDEPTPAIEVSHENESVRIMGCQVYEAIPWPSE
jgi:hypothetical protein